MVERNDVFKLTEEQMNLIDKMFWGPYKPEWKDKKGRAENGDGAIARRLGLKETVVSIYTDRISKDHFNRIKEERNLPKTSKKIK